MTELFHPNLVTGIAGAIAVILGLVGFGSLPLNVAGLLLVGFGITLFGLETSSSHGLLALGGVVCVVLGAAVLYTAPMDRPPPGAGPVSVSPGVILAIAATAGLVALGLALVAASGPAGCGHRRASSGRPSPPARR